MDPPNGLGVFCVTAAVEHRRKGGFYYEEKVFFLIDLRYTITELVGFGLISSVRQC